MLINILGLIIDNGTHGSMTAVHLKLCMKTSDNRGNSLQHHHDLTATAVYRDQINAHEVFLPSGQT